MCGFRVKGKKKGACECVEKFIGHRLLDLTGRMKRT